MTKGIITAALVFSSVINGFSQTAALRPIHIGLIYPISTNGIYAADFTNTVSLHAIAGVSGSEQAFSAAGVTNIVRRDANGLTAAGFSNHIGHDAHGLQAAGFMNGVRNAASGMQAAGFLNVAGSMQGVQAAGFANIVRTSSGGLQAAGFANIAANAQVQAAGFINVAKDVDGGQVAGFINVARKVHGVQVSGFMNIAESSDYPIGLVNIIQDGDAAVGFSMDESQTMLLSLRSGGRVLYGIIGAGFNGQHADFHLRRRKILYALEAGFGAHLTVSPHFRINVEGVSVSLSNFRRGVNLKSSLRVLPAVTIGNHLEVFAGPTLSHVFYNNNTGRDLIHNYFWSETRRSYFNGLYIGGIAGVQVRF